MRKSCRAEYFASKVANLKKSNPKSWWTEVKRISGMRPVPGSLLNQLRVEDTEHLTQFCRFNKKKRNRTNEYL
jgi:hypothetical protein